MRTQSKTNDLFEVRGEQVNTCFSLILIGWEGGVNLRAIYSEDTPMRPTI